MAKSTGIRGKFQRLMPITTKNIGKAWVKWRGKKLYLNGIANTDPIETVTRQQLRRQVIQGRKHRSTLRQWRKTGAPARLGGPTPARLTRPKHHRWLTA